MIVIKTLQQFNRFSLCFHCLHPKSTSAVRVPAVRAPRGSRLFGLPRVPWRRVPDPGVLEVVLWEPFPEHLRAGQAHGEGGVFANRKCDFVFLLVLVFFCLMFAFSFVYTFVYTVALALALALAFFVVWWKRWEIGGFVFLRCVFHLTNGGNLSRA